MKAFISLLQIIVGILLILIIVIQEKGSGIGATFGGDFSMYRTKRGAEKMLFYLTIFLSTLFVLLSLAGLII